MNRVYLLGFNSKNQQISCRPSPQGEAVPQDLIEEGVVYGLYNHRGELTAVINDRNDSAELPESIEV